MYPSFTLHVTHTLAHTYQFPSSPWASALDHYKVSVLKSIVGWTSARNNEQMNKRSGGDWQTDGCQRNNVTAAGHIHQQPWQNSLSMQTENK